MAKKNKSKVEPDNMVVMDTGQVSEINLIKHRYQAGINYLRSQQYYDKWAEYDRFWNSDQWPQLTAKTKKYPRPVTNHFASIIEQKIAAITYDMPSIYFDPVDSEPIGIKVRQQLPSGVEAEPVDLDAAEVLSHVAEDQWEKLEMDDLLDNVSRTSALMGVGIGFFPWDNTTFGGGKNSLYLGDIQGFEIDPVDFFPGNPHNPDIQSQPYLLMAERLPLSTVRELYKGHAPDVVAILKPDRKSGDREVYDQQHVEMDQTDYVDLIHCWEKVPTSGKVPTPSEEATFDGVEVNQQDLLNSLEVDDYRLEYTVVAQNFILRKEEELYEHGLYPFAVFQWYPKRFSFYGKPESADLINNQKEENRLAGISLVSAYQTGLPNIRYKEGFVEKTDIPNGPGGGIIADNSPPGSWGIDFMIPPTPAAHIPQLRQATVDGMKESTGVHEAWSGKMTGSQLNASAIIALQEAAGIRIRGIQRRLRKTIRQIGMIWLAHWKEFMEEDRFIKVVGEGKLKGHLWFRGTDYREFEFDVRVQAGNASPFSKSLEVAHLDKMVERGIISTEEYLECVPREVFPQSEKILRHRVDKQEEQRRMELEQKKAMITEMVNEIVDSAQQAGVPITPEALEGMLEMINALASQSMQEMEENNATKPPGSPGRPAGRVSDQKRPQISQEMSRTLS